MATAEPQATALFVDRMGAALPQAISDAFGGDTKVETISADTLPSLLSELSSGRHVHLELEANAGRHQSRPIVMVLGSEDATQMFGLDPTPEDDLSDPETQLRVLAEFTEGAEALAGALAGTLTAAGSIVSLRVSGASLEDADASAAAAVGPLGDHDTAAFCAVLKRPGGASVPVVVAAPSDLALTIGNGLGDGKHESTAGDAAAERAANLAAMTGARRASVPEQPAKVAEPAVIAHPFSFSQLDPGGTSAQRADRNIDPLLDVALQVRVELGSTQMTVEEVLALSLGSVVELDRLAGEPVDIVVNNRLLARGEVVVVEENFGVRITEIINSRQRVAA